jgi:hypothetical protein
MAGPGARAGAVLAVLALCAGPERLAAPPPPPLARPAPAAAALRVAATATASEWTGAAAALPGRARLSLARGSEAALDAWLPEAPLARARAWQDRLQAWHAAARAAQRAARPLALFSRAAGGPLAALDRALDAAALLALAAIGLHRVLRQLRARRG